MLLSGIALLGSAGSAARTTPGWTIHVDLSVDIDYVDPAQAYYLPSWQILFATCLKLVNHPDGGGPRSATVIPEAAPFPRISRGGRVYTFDVRVPFTRFSDGTSVTARSFAATLTRARDPRSNSPAKEFLRDLQSVRVRGSRLILRLDRPAGDFLTRLAMPFACVLPEGTPVAPDGIEAPVPSAGPYYIASWQRNRSIELRRNPFYRGRRPRGPDKVVYAIGNPDETSRLRIWRRQTDWYPAGPSPYAWQYGWPPIRRHVFPANAVRHLFVDSRPGKPFAAVRLRRAVALAVDRTALASPNGRRIGRPTDSLIPLVVPPTRARRVYPVRPDLERARELVRGLVPLRVTLHQSNRYPAPIQSRMIQAQLRAIGIEADIIVGPRDKVAAPCGADLVLLDTAASYPGAASVLGSFASRLRRDCGIEPTWVRQFERINRLRGARRHAGLATLERSLTHGAIPAIALHSTSSVHYFSRRVGCVRAHWVYEVDIAALCRR